MDNEIIRVIEIPKTLPIMTRAVVDVKSRIDLIRDIEGVIRKSIEYRYYIQYLKKELNITKCSFLKNINTSKSKFRKISLEFHHYPYTLWDIVEIMLDKMSTESVDGRYNAFEVANNVMVLHYTNNVGLVPLTKTMHQLAHSGRLEIAVEDTHGNVKSFYDDYKFYMSEHNIDTYTTFISKTKKITDNLNVGVLTVKKQKIELVGVGVVEQIPVNIENDKEVEL